MISQVWEDGDFDKSDGICDGKKWLDFGYILQEEAKRVWWEWDVVGIIKVDPEDLDWATEMEKTVRATRLRQNVFWKCKYSMWMKVVRGISISYFIILKLSTRSIKLL